MNAQQQISVFDLIQESEREVRPIRYEDAISFVFAIHYSRRMPCVTHAFGLFVKGQMIGVVTYGMPASPSLCIGIAGEEDSGNVLELNRLALLPEFNGGGGTTQAIWYLTP